MKTYKQALTSLAKDKATALAIKGFEEMIEQHKQHKLLGEYLKTVINISFETKYYRANEEEGYRGIVRACTEYAGTTNSTPAECFEQLAHLCGVSVAKYVGVKEYEDDYTTYVLGSDLPEHMVRIIELDGVPSSHYVSKYPSGMYVHTLAHATFCIENLEQELFELRQFKAKLDASLVPFETENPHATQITISEVRGLLGVPYDCTKSRNDWVDVHVDTGRLIACYKDSLNVYIVKRKVRGN